MLQHTLSMFSKLIWSSDFFGYYIYLLSFPTLPFVFKTHFCDCIYITTKNQLYLHQRSAAVRKFLETAKADHLQFSERMYHCWSRIRCFAKYLSNLTHCFCRRICLLDPSDMHIKGLKMGVWGIVGAMVLLTWEMNGHGPWVFLSGAHLGQPQKWAQVGKSMVVAAIVTWDSICSGLHLGSMHKCLLDCFVYIFRFSDKVKACSPLIKL